MLRLLPATYIPVASVMEYYNSAKEEQTTLNFALIVLATKGYEMYYEYLRKSKTSLYFMIYDQNPNFILGYGTIKEDRTEFNQNKYGNLAYHIRITERHKGYGSILLHLLLNECEERGMAEVDITCLKSNEFSQNIITKNQGIYIETFQDAFSNKEANRYKIILHPTILKRVKHYLKKV